MWIDVISNFVLGGLFFFAHRREKGMETLKVTLYNVEKRRRKGIFHILWPFK
jgi:hypothetical protein